MSLVNMAKVVSDIDRLIAERDHYRQQAEAWRAKYELVNCDYADLKSDMEELSAHNIRVRIERDGLARENADLRAELGRSEDRRYEP